MDMAEKQLIQGNAKKRSLG